MERLSYGDMGQLLAAIQELYAHTEFESLPRLMIALQRRLVPCEVSTYNEIDTRTNELRVVHDYPHEDAEKMFPQFMAHLEEYPLSRRYEATGDRAPMKMSDFLSDREFRDLGLYQDFYKYFGITRQIAYFLPRCSTDFPILMGLQRMRRDYTERDRSILNQLAPHFEQAWQNARALSLAHQRASGASELMGKLGQGLIFLNRDRRVVWMTGRAEKWMETYFQQDITGVGLHLPRVVQDWINGLVASVSAEARIGQPRMPLGVILGDRRLRIRWMEASPQESCLVLSEDVVTSNPADLDRLGLGLTKREREVLHWMLEGKNNPEIGIILGASPNTVRKHAEHIFAKLGVENRLSALRRVRDLAGSESPW